MKPVPTVAYGLPVVERTVRSDGSGYNYRLEDVCRVCGCKVVVTCWAVRSARRHLSERRCKRCNVERTLRIRRRPVRKA